jgi:hypothetical protein
MMIAQTVAALSLLTAACGEARKGEQPPSEQSKPAVTSSSQVSAAVGGSPTAAQLEEARAFPNHPYVLGLWKIPEAQRPLMRCVQIGTVTRTAVATGESTKATKLSNRCGFPIRFTGTVGKKDVSGTICVAELRPTGLLPPGDGFDLPGVDGGNCFDDIEELVVVDDEGQS